MAHYINIVCIRLDTQESSYLMDCNISKQNAVDGPRQRDLDVLEGILKMRSAQPSHRFDDFTT